MGNSSAGGRTIRPWAAALMLVVVIVFAGALLTVTVAGEPRVGTLHGRVLDTKGRPIPSAFVTVPATEDDYRVVRTGPGGEWRAARVPVGYHRIGACLRGYQYGETASGSLAEGRDLRVTDIVLQPAQSNLNVSAASQNTLPGSRQRLYLSGAWPERRARVRFAIYPFNIAAARISQDRPFYDVLEDAGGRLSGKARPVWSWERAYSTDERDGSFSGGPRTPVLDKPGTYVLVAQIGAVRSAAAINVTDLAVTVKADSSGMLVWAASLQSGAPVTGASVQVFQAGKAVARARTGSNGLALLHKPAGEQVVAVARTGRSMAIAGPLYADGGGPADSLLYTDRPLYRPGHTVCFKGIFRQRLPGTYRNLKGCPVKFAVLDPEGSVVADIPAATGPFGTASGSWTVPEDARLGRWSLRATVGEKSVWAGFSVEEYRKPEYSVSVNIPRPHYITGEPMEAKVRANYYFGAPVANAEVTYTVYRSDWYFAVFDRDYESWFEDTGQDYGYDSGGYGDVLKEGRGRTDANGELSVSVDTSGQTETARFTVEVRVVDPTMREVTAQAGASVVPAAFAVTVTPDRYVRAVGDTAQVKLRSVDWDGQPVPGRRLKVEVQRRKWTSHREAMEQIALGQVTTDSAGLATYTAKLEKEGDIVFTATGEDSEHRRTKGQGSIWVTSDSFLAEEPSPEREDFTLTPDRKMYHAGDTAKVLIQSRQPDAWVLLTVEGERLFETRVVRLSGRGRTVSIPVKPGYLPGVYVSCTLMGKGELRQTSAELAVSPEASLLTVKVQPDRERYRPGERAHYIIRTLDSDGRGVPAEVSFGVVDESIYALRADSTPDIRKFFWGPHGNRVVSASSVDQSYWGGVDKFESHIRRYFPDTAYWNPEVRTDALGRAEVTFTWPDSLTTWRATARAVTADTHVGSAVRKCIVTKDLIVRMQAPRFFRERDTQTLALVVHNYTGAPKRVEVRLSAEGIRLQGANSRRLSVPGGGVARAEFDISVPAPGKARLTASVRALDGSAMDALQTDYLIFPHGTSAHQTAAGVAGDSGAALAIPPDSRVGTAALRVDLTPSVAGAVVQALRYLVQYPWGCVEQVTSSFVPDIAAERAMRTLKAGPILPQRQLDKMVALGVRKLGEMQHPDGSWGWYWEPEADPTMTAYVLLSLVEARQAGAAVPQQRLARAADWIATHTLQPLPNRPSARDWNEAGPEYRSLLERRAFALLAAEAAGKNRAKQAAQLWMRGADLTDFAVACLGLAADRRGDSAELARAAQSLERRATRAAGVMFWHAPDGWDNWSDVAATAMAMRTLGRAGRSTASLEGVARWLMLKRDGGYWRSTRDSALTVMALVEHLERIQPAACRAVVEVNGRRVAAAKFSAGDWFQAPQSINVPVGLLRNGVNRLTVRGEGTAPVFWTADLAYVTAQEDAPAKPSYFRITREFLRISLEKSDDGTLKERCVPLKGQVRTGEILRMRLKVTPQASAAYVLVDCPLPSGFEVVKRDVQWGFGCSGLEVHDQKVGLFSRTMRGPVTLETDVRAEIPGSLHVMPAEAYAMYAPRLYGRSAETRFAVR